MKSSEPSPRAIVQRANAIQRVSQPTVTLVNNRPSAILQRKLQNTINTASNQVLQRQVNTVNGVAQFGRKKKKGPAVPKEVTEVNQEMAQADQALEKANALYNQHKDSADLSDDTILELRIASGEARRLVEYVVWHVNAFERSLEVPVGGAKPDYFTKLETDYKKWVKDAKDRLSRVEEAIFPLTDIYRDKDISVDSIDHEKPRLVESLIMRGKLTVNSTGYYKGQSGQSRKFNEAPDWSVHLHNGSNANFTGHFKHVDTEYEVGYKTTNPVSNMSLRKLGINPI